MTSKTLVKMAFVGFMGSGKSTLAGLVGECLPSLEIIDLDRLMLCGIAQKAGFSQLGDYIRSVGFWHFRRLETQVLCKTIQNKGSLCLSLGGGAYRNPNRIMLQQSGFIVIWLKVPFDKCWQRIKADHNRPLVAQGEVELAKLYQERINDYVHADHVLEDNEIPSDRHQCEIWIRKLGLTTPR